MICLVRPNFARLVASLTTVALVGCTTPSVSDTNFLTVSETCDAVCVEQRSAIVSAGKSRIILGTAVGAIAGGLIGAQLTRESSSDRRTQLILMGALAGGTFGNIVANEAERKRIALDLARTSTQIASSQTAFEALVARREQQIEDNPADAQQYVAAYQQDVQLARSSYQRLESSSRTVALMLETAQNERRERVRTGRPTASRAEILRLQREAGRFVARVAGFKQAVETSNRKFVGTYISCDTSTENSEDDSDRFTSIPGPSCAPAQN